MGAQYFAQIDDNNVVTSVHCATQDFLDANSDRYQGTWVETFFDRADKQYAGIGMIYDEASQDFKTVQPYPSWTWANKTWNPPTPYPSDSESYVWNETNLDWVEV
jgi:hypothetical protein